MGVILCKPRSVAPFCNSLGKQSSAAMGFTNHSSILRAEVSSSELKSTGTARQQSSQDLTAEHAALVAQARV